MNPLEQLLRAVAPFVNLFNDREDVYRARGGKPEIFPDTHPFVELEAQALNLGQWRALRIAFLNYQRGVNNNET
jgi:hypothetical protein